MEGGAVRWGEGDGQWGGRVLRRNTLHGFHIFRDIKAIEHSNSVFDKILPVVQKRVFGNYLPKEEAVYKNPPP